MVDATERRWMSRRKVSRLVVKKDTLLSSTCIYGIEPLSFLHLLVRFLAHSFSSHD